MNAQVWKAWSLTAILALAVGVVSGAEETPSFSIQRGVNISHWLSQSARRGADRLAWFTEDDVRRIADFGYDHIRLPVDEEQLWDEQGGRQPEAFQLLHSGIRWARGHGLRVVVDLHILRSHHFNAAEKPLWTEPAAQERFFALWRDLSAALKDYPVEWVAYELMNEPVADDPEDWNRLVEKAVGEIRTLEPDRKIVIGSNRWQSPSTFDQLRIPEGDRNLILSFHFYQPMLVTHYQAGWTSVGRYKGPIQYPGQLVDPEDVEGLPEDIQRLVRNNNGVWNRERIEAAIAKPLAVAKKTGLPLYCGEWGCIKACPREERLRWYADVQSVLEEHGIAWANWDYKGGFGILTREGGPDEELIDTLIPSDAAAGASLSIQPGPVNSAVIEKNGRRLVLYGDAADTIDEADMVLFTHARRDVAWAGRGLVERGAQAVVPAAERDFFENPETFWREFTKKRFRDANQQTTKILTRPIPVVRAVEEGDVLEWQGIPIQVLETPGYTRGGISYLVEIDGRTCAFVGDLIYGDGRLLDLYSLQDAVPEARIGGYHGWAGRMGAHIASLRKIAAHQPDLMIAARGPVVENPPEAIDALIRRLQAVYRNYLSVSAGRWYFRDHYDILARRVLGPEPDVPWMPYAQRIDSRPPDWVIPIHNARLILSETGRGVLIDCGGQGIINELKKLRDAGTLQGLDGLFITHYHADHTDGVPALLEEFACPVYACETLSDILLRPGAYRLPVISPRVPTGLRSVPDGRSVRWHEFTLTAYDHPGQTIYHDALLVERDGGGRMFFVGDSFTPSGMDDYCLLNRNLLHDGRGYLYCLDALRGLPGDCLLNNQHVLEPFRYSPEQIDLMEQRLRERKRLLAELFPWDEPNYGVDERWTRLFPYGSQVRPGDAAAVEIRILNHSERPHEYSVQLHAPEGVQVEPSQCRLMVAPQTEGAASFSVRVLDGAPGGVRVVTADVSFGEWTLPRWTEAMIEVLE